MRIRLHCVNRQSLAHICAHHAKRGMVMRLSSLCIAGSFISFAVGDVNLVVFDCVHLKAAECRMRKSFALNVFTTPLFASDECEHKGLKRHKAIGSVAHIAKPA